MPSVSKDKSFVGCMLYVHLAMFKKVMHGGRCVQDVAMSGLVLTLNACIEGRVSAEYTEIVFECVRAAAADADWRDKLVSTINDLHTCADGIGPIAVRTIPETAVLVLLRRAPARIRRPLGRLHLCTEPQGPSKDPGSQQKATHRPHMRLAYLLSCLMSISPAEILSACEAPATDFNQLSPEKQALEPSMEYTVMEIIHAALVSGAAFSKGSGGQSAWDAWLWNVLQGRYESATVDRAGVIVLAIAHAHRLIANQAIGAQKLAPQISAGDAAQMLESTTTAMCKLLEKWSGTSASDRKHALLLAYSLDMLMQVLFPCLHFITSVISKCCMVRVAGSAWLSKLQRRCPFRLPWYAGDKALESNCCCCCY